MSGSQFYSPLVKAERLTSRQSNQQQQRNHQNNQQSQYQSNNYQHDLSHHQNGQQSYNNNNNNSQQPRFTFDAAATSATNFSLMNSNHNNNNNRQSRNNHHNHNNNHHQQFDSSSIPITTASIVDSHHNSHLSFTSDDLLKSSARCKGNSCHQCKTNKDPPHLYFCTAKNDHPMGKRNCRKKYCLACMSRWYKGLLHTGMPGHQQNNNNNNNNNSCQSGWLCPSCTGVCVCAACDRKKDKKKQQDIADDPNAPVRLDNNGSKRDRSEISPSDNPSGSSSPIPKNIKAEPFSPLMNGSNGDSLIIPKLEPIHEMNELNLPLAPPVYSNRINTDPSNNGNNSTFNISSNQRIHSLNNNNNGNISNTNNKRRPPLPTLSLPQNIPSQYNDSESKHSNNSGNNRARGSTRALSANTSLPLSSSYTEAVREINKYYHTVNGINEIHFNDGRNNSSASQQQQQRQRNTQQRNHQNSYDQNNNNNNSHHYHHNHRHSITSEGDVPALGTFSSSTSSQVSTPTLLSHGQGNQSLAALPYHQNHQSHNHHQNHNNNNNSSLIDNNNEHHKRISSLNNNNSNGNIPNIGALFENGTISLSAINTPSLASPAISVPCSPRGLNFRHVDESLINSSVLSDIHSDPFNPSPLFNPGLSLNGDEFHSGGTQTPSFWMLKSATNSVAATPRNAIGEHDFNALFSN